MNDLNPDRRKGDTSEQGSTRSAADPTKRMAGSSSKGSNTKEKQAAGQGKIPYKYYDNVADLKKLDRWRRVKRSVILAIIYIVASVISGYFFGVPGLLLAWIIITSGLVPKVVVPTPDAYFVIEDAVVYGSRKVLRLDKDLKVKVDKERNLISIKSKWMTLLFLYTHEPETLAKILSKLATLDKGTS